MKNIRKSAFGVTGNIINQSSQIELTYRLSYRQYIGNGQNYVGISYGSLSRNEMIRGDELNLTANYIGYETRWALSNKISIGLSYNRTISNIVKNRDQLQVFAKHDF